MENAIRINLSRQMALRNEMDIIANNLANQSTSGYRNLKLKFSEYMIPDARANEFTGADKRLSYVLDESTVTDLTFGSLNQTGNPLNVALADTGWFTVETPDGERLTRDGNFEINDQGTLVTSSGYPILGEGGPITVGDDASTFLIDLNGYVSTDNGAIGKLKIVDFENPSTIKHEGGNLFSFSEPYQTVEFPNVNQGFIENANVQPILEISRMLAVTRAYTMVSDLLKQEDKLRNESIARLASVPS